jgi:helix-turn-helix protein
MTDAAATARRMWTLFEPVHVISYFASPAKGAFEQAGLRGFWRGYFAGRAAPIGQVGAAPVIAAFFSFAPAMVTRALPAVWDLISPVQALAVREAGAVAALRELLGLTNGDPVPGPVAATADRLIGVAGHADFAGRTLGASNAALPVPAEPLARLWHAATVLREHRGDGHIAALVAADIDGPEALALRVGVYLSGEGGNGGAPPGSERAQLQPARGWTDDEWDEAVARLVRRGLLKPDGAATAAGAQLHRSIEAATDQAAARPWARLPGTQADELAELLLPIASACAVVVPFPNPVGVPTPRPPDRPPA